MAVPTVSRRAGTAPPARGTESRRWQRAVREVVLLAVAGLAYSLVRGLTDDRVDVAFANAGRVIDLERGLGIFVEPRLQDAVVDTPVVHVANALYILYWPIIIGAFAWLLLRHPDRYPVFRNAVLVSGAISLAIFAAFPLAPPRFLAGNGFTDTIAVHSAGYRDFNASALVNEYAAMPSLHLGWVLLVTLAAMSVVRSRGARIALAGLPVAMFAAIVLTGNHFVVDGVVGAAVVLTGLLVARALDRTPATDRPRPASTPSARTALRSARRRVARSLQGPRR